MLMIRKVATMEKVETKTLSTDAYRLHDTMLAIAVGSKNSKTAEEVCMWMGYYTKNGNPDTRRLRLLVNEIISLDSPLMKTIIASGNGYFIPTEQEAEERYINYYHMLHSQAMALLVKCSAVKKRISRDGQQRLPLTPYMETEFKVGVAINIAEGEQLNA